MPKVDVNILMANLFRLTNIEQRSAKGTQPFPQKKKSLVGSSKIVSFAVVKYNRYVKWYEGILERRYPSVFKIYKIVKHGKAIVFLYMLF